MSARSGYSTVQIILHWLIAVMIAVAWLLGDGMHRALDDRIAAGTTGTSGNTLHVWVGGAVMLLVLIRVVVRLVTGAPAPVASTPDWQEKAAIWGHRALYALMILVPLLGALAWYGHIEPAGELHTLAVNLLVLLVLGHAGFALYHHFMIKDDTLNRMLRRDTR